MKQDEGMSWLPGHQIAERIRGGSLSANEVVETALRRIAAIEPSIHSFITVSAEIARERAAQIDALPQSEKQGDLLGVPFSAKDNILTAGVRTTAASRLLETFVPAEDAAVISRLDAAGAVLLGKANLPEFSMWGRSRNLVAEECRNPWDLRRTCGGSSGGSGAAVAAGLVPISIGTDDGGSIRLPAALNGVLGLFPSPGRVPLDGVIIGGVVSAAGPLTRDVRDAALFLDAMTPGAGFAQGMDAGIAGLRMAWISEVEGLAVNDPRVAACARAAASVLAQAAGTALDEPGLGLVDALWGAAAVLSPFPDATYGGLRPWHLPEIQRAIAEPGWEERLAPNARPDSVSGAEAAPPSEEAKQVLRRVVEQMDGIFARCDVLFTPTIDQIAPLITDDWIYPYAPPEAGPQEAIRQYVKYTLPVNVAGCCAVSIPCGFVDGMPVGLQAIGRRGAELTLLRVARTFEQISPWAGARPALTGHD
jgi:Asp-tRNA(Asn)/Glu-tRNA(Gln) amidotransferase A subunit family amidase